MKRIDFFKPKKNGYSAIVVCEVPKNVDNNASKFYKKAIKCIYGLAKVMGRTDAKSKRRFKYWNNQCEKNMARHFQLLDRYSRSTI